MVAEVNQTSREAPRYASHILVRWMFLRGLGFVYLIAFASFLWQATGLIGEHGILPVRSFLKEASPALGSVPFLTCPTLFWIDCSDNALRLLPAAGILCALMVMVGVLTGPMLFLSWIMYLSIVTVGGDFMSFQWDILLLEVGFLAMFYSHQKFFDWPLGKTAASIVFQPPSTAVLWLLRLVLFKLMLSSGCVKLLSGDLTWHNFTALHYHYWTQPLPTPLAWIAAQLPDWFQSVSVAVMFFIELVVPFFIFAPGKFRLLAASLTAFLQFLILLTGNYTFFNLLTILLCLLLLSDRELLAISARVSSRLVLFGKGLIGATVVKPTSLWRKTQIAVLSVFILTLTLGRQVSVMPEPVKLFAYFVSPWCIVNGYGLFAVMTTSRKEIIVEGSQDGVTWEPYEFNFKPGDVHRAPPWVAPYQPRLDWQMWFAALGTRRDSPWFSHFVLRLLQNTSDVKTLLKTVPFAGAPPKLVRASLYDYEFTNFDELTKSGAWWRRKHLGLFFPEASLREDSDK